VETSTTPETAGDEESDAAGRPFRVKLRKTQYEQMFSELPLNADIDRFSHARN